MKKITISTFLLVNVFCFAQQQIVSQNYSTGTQPIYYTLQSSSGKTLNYDDIPGTTYPDKDFMKAKISGTTDEQVPIRYNSYNDEIEFKKEDKVLALPKKTEYEVFPVRRVIDWLWADPLSRAEGVLLTSARSRRGTM